MALFFLVSLATIVVFALLYSAVGTLLPTWGFIADPAQPDVPVQSLDEILLFSLYVYFHFGSPLLLTPHGPEHILVGGELAMSWGWLLLLGAKAVDDVHRLRTT